jgi:hypothetical protein
MALTAENVGFYSQGEFVVKKGAKGFIQLCSHKATGLEDNTSTQVAGTINDMALYGNKPLPGFNGSKYWIYFDTCEGDVDLKETFIIADHATNNRSGSHSATAYSGYIRDSFGTGLEGVEVWGNGYLRAIADHNGFYHFSMYDDDLGSASIRVERSCGGAFQDIAPAFVIANTTYGMTERNYDIKNAEYNNGFYTNLEVRAVDCDGIGVGGVRIAVSGSKYRVTESDGIARFKIRNYSNRHRSLMVSFHQREADVLKFYGEKISIRLNCNG